MLRDKMILSKSGGNPIKIKYRPVHNSIYVNTKFTIFWFNIMIVGR